MKLLLTSAGLCTTKIEEFFATQFDSLKDKTACLVTSALTPEEQLYENDAKRVLENFGIKVSVMNIAKNDAIELSEDFDIYYVCGGNTFFILDRLRKTGMDKILTDAAQKGKFYLGVSAGSIIAGPDIEVATLGEFGDRNDVGLQDLAGLCLVPQIISPHYIKEEEQALEAFKAARAGEPVVPLTDQQALFIKDGKETLI